MKHQYIPLYTSFFKESFPKTYTEIAIKKACKIIGQRIGTKLYPSLIKQDVIKADGRKLSGIIATFGSVKQIRFNWKMTDTSSTIVGVDIWENVKQKLFTPTKELVFENDENILQIIDAIVQAIQSKEKNAVLKIVESADRMREDVIAVDTKTQGKVSQEVRASINAWSEGMGIDDSKLANTRFATLFSDFSYWYEEVNTDKSLKKLNYGTFRNYLLAYMEKYNIVNIFMRSIVSKDGTKERVIVTDEVSERNFNKELYKLDMSDQFALARANINQVLSGMRVATCISGKAGTGKTELVKNILGELKGKAKIVYLKGDVSKPVDLYNKIAETNGDNVVVVWDDMDTPFVKKQQFASLLKSAFDPNMRIMSFIDSKHGDDKKKKSEFLVKSRFIIITNISKDRMDSAVESRLNPVEISADNKGMLDYLHMNLDGILPEYKIPREVKVEVLDFMYSVLKDIKFINFRVFQDALRYRFCEPLDPKWKKFVYSMLTKTVK